MLNPLPYALILAVTLGLAACEKTPEDKMEAAKESASEAMESLGDAAKESGEAAERKADQITGHQPTAGEKAEEAKKD